jgi:hypothetical protein
MDDVLSQQASRKPPLDHRRKYIESAGTALQIIEGRLCLIIVFMISTGDAVLYKKRDKREGDVVSWKILESFFIISYVDGNKH